MARFGMGRFLGRSRPVESILSPSASPVSCSVHGDLPFIQVHSRDQEIAPDPGRTTARDDCPSHPSPHLRLHDPQAFHPVAVAVFHQVRVAVGDLLQRVEILAADQRGHLLAVAVDQHPLARGHHVIEIGAKLRAEGGSVSV